MVKSGFVSPFFKGQGVKVKDEKDINRGNNVGIIDNKKPADVSTGVSSNQPKSPFLQAPAPDATSVSTGEAVHIPAPSGSPQGQGLSSMNALQADAGSPRGMSNVRDTLQASLFPRRYNTVHGGESSIVANFDSAALNKVSELVANNPFGAAAIGAVAWTAAANLIAPAAAINAAGATGTAAIPATIVGETVTPVVTVGTQTVVRRSIIKLVAALRKPKIYIPLIAGTVTASLGGKAFSKFLEEETSQTVGFAKSKGYDQGIYQGDWTAFQTAIDLERQVWDDNTVWNEVVSYIPWANVIQAVNKYREYAQASIDVWDKMAEVQQESQASGEDADAIAAAKEDSSYQANIDYYNSERKKMLAYEENARRESRESEAAFWAAEREKQREAEEEDRKAIADFWEAYRKKAQKAADDARPSKLGFGLL